MQYDTVLSIEAIREGLAKDSSLSLAARATGLHYNQVWRIARGVDANLRYDNLKKLSDYILERDAAKETQGAEG